MPFFRCKDVGRNCPWEATAETEDELMKKVAEHLKKEHGVEMEELSPEVIDLFKEAIKK